MQQSLSSLVDPINRLWQPVALFKGNDFFGELHLRHGGKLVREEMPNHDLKIKMVMMDCPKTMYILILLLPLFVLNLQSVPPSPCWLTEYWEICYLHQHFYRHRSFHFQYLTPPFPFHEKHGSPQHNCSLSVKFSASFLPEGLHRRGGLLHSSMESYTFRHRKILSKPSHYQGRAGAANAGRCWQGPFFLSS